MRYHAYKIELEGASLKVFGDRQCLFSIDLLRCIPPSGFYQVMAEVAKRNDIHEAAQSALSRAIGELLTDVFVDEERTGEKKLHLDRWNADVANAFHIDASRYQQTNN